MIKTHTYSRKEMEETTDPIVASTFGMPPPSNTNTASRLAQIDDMKFFFATATQQWEHNKPLKRFALPGGESISCVLWDDLFFVTGTDIVRSLNFRFHAFGRPVKNAKKFEEGIFSDLRNLKPGHDARLEEPKSELLDMLYKNNCIRTQKKQKVFFWFSVPHDRLFLDALERDLKREKMGMEPTTQAIAEPATSLSLDSTQELFDQLRKTSSQSAAATSQAIEEDMSTPVPNTSISLTVGHVTDLLKEDHNWPTSPTPTVNHPPWSSSQSRLERAASQAKRSRVNSVPANIGQKQQLQLRQQQKHHRLSHGSYFSGGPLTSTSRNRPSRSSASSLLSSSDDLLVRDDSSSTSTLSEHKYPQDYMDPISNGVNQLEISASLSNTSHSTSSSLLQHNVLPSKSLDSNAMKKTKTIFGNLSLFDGSPTYKQRRRRAASVSSSVMNSPLHVSAGGPDRVRRHDKCHLRTAPSSVNHHRTPPNSTGNSNKLNNSGKPPSSTSAHHLSHMNSSNVVNSNSSRFAMAAMKAGFAPEQIISTPTPPTPMMNTHSQGWPQQQPQQQPQDYYCPIADCRHLFKRPEHLERHMQALHMFFICTVCGKQFPRSEHLAQHHRLEHEIQHYDHVSSLSGGDNDDDSSPDDHTQRHPYLNTNNSYQTSQQVLNHHQHQTDGNGFYTSPRHSFDGSRSSGWSTAVSESVTSSQCSGTSRCSTLSPMLDIDFEMPDIQPTSQPIVTTILNTPISASRSNTSLTTDSSSNVTMLDSLCPETTTSRNNCFIKQEETRPLTQKSHTPNSSFNEDDLSSSSTSSPSSTFHYRDQYSTTMRTGEVKLEYSSASPLTLLSSFKPNQQNQQQQQLLLLQEQQQQQQEHQVQQLQELDHQSNIQMMILNNDMFEDQQHYDLSMDTTMFNHPLDNYQQSMYAPFTDQQQQYSPFNLSSTDTLLAFGA